MQIFRRFVQTETSGGDVLLLATISALLLGKSPWSDGYTQVWQTELSIGAGGYSFTETVLHWI
jgi:NhaA family Na+:H+ antiporter